MNNSISLSLILEHFQLDTKKVSRLCPEIIIYPRFIFTRGFKRSVTSLLTRRY